MKLSQAFTITANLDEPITFGGSDPDQYQYIAHRVAVTMQVGMEGEVDTFVEAVMPDHQVRSTRNPGTWASVGLIGGRITIPVRYWDDPQITKLVTLVSMGASKARTEVRNVLQVMPV